MITCQICQHENPEGAEYCENCGAALPAESTPASVTTPPATDAMTPADVSPQEASPVAEPAGQTAPLTVPPDMEASDATAPAGASVDPAEAAVAQAPAESAPATASTGQNPRLVGVRYGAPTGDAHPLLGQRLVVGRFDAETGPVDIDLSQAPESEQISRQHAEIYREADGRWFVKDLGSTNGVFVKTAGAATFGPRLTAPQALTSGDEIGFGNARFIFQMD